MTIPANIRVNTQAPFPALVKGSGVITLTKTNGIWTVGLSTAALQAEVAALGVREILATNRTYYVRANGNDGNDGLTNSAGGAFLTWLGAYTKIIQTIDFNGYTVTIQGDGSTFTTGLETTTGWIGGGVLALDGNGSTINQAAGDGCIAIFNPGVIQVLNFTLSNSGACYAAIWSGDPDCSIVVLGGMTFGEFGPGGSTHLLAQPGYIYVGNSYTISGGAGNYHAWALEGGFIQLVSGITVTISAAATFGSAFVGSFAGGDIIADGLIFVNPGNVTGQRFAQARFSEIIGSTATTPHYFPGTVEGGFSSITDVIRVVTAAGAVTVSPSDRTVIINKGVGAATAVTLPVATLSDGNIWGQIITIKDGKGDAGANPITVSPSAGTIDGAATSVINTAYESKSYVYNGTEWNVLSNTPNVLPQRSVTASPITIVGSDYCLNININAGAPTCTLPLASARNGVPLIFKDSGGHAAAHNITITATGPDTIDGAAFVTVALNFQSITLNPFQDGVNSGWFIT